MSQLSEDLASVPIKKILIFFSGFALLILLLTEEMPVEWIVPPFTSVLWGYGLYTLLKSRSIKKGLLSLGLGSILILSFWVSSSTVELGLLLGVILISSIMWNYEWYKNRFGIEMHVLDQILLNVRTFLIYFTILQMSEHMWGHVNVLAILFIFTSMAQVLVDIRLNKKFNWLNSIVGVLVLLVVIINFFIKGV
ncbi:hypothetical protein [Pontibacillus marinus]|uniref:Uncharacterized protein n=1 Tax=Pontibacillus marinus BH030004 = DSM 16465 TaxID=1385511 RepID=A0A0A5FWF2_9BACI|nr:hypothetical protein [Pontibacillus marinus]KGX84259.1 hypothetical protein N783_17975 [Pontibacillus marinus BH030004 = DSM 16465]